MTEKQPELSRLAAAVENLLRETERLKNDVGRLSDRLTPFEDEQPLSPPGEAMPIRNLKEAFDAIAEAGKRVWDSELHLNFIRSQMDSIERNVTSRDEIKKWTKPRF